MKLHASLLLACVLAAASSCTAGTNDTELRSVTRAEALDLIERDDGPLFLDVRSTSEFATGHVPGAINIPHGELAKRLDDLEAQRDREIVLYCERGVRAEIAADVLAQAGFRSLAHLEGDMSAWRQERLPMQRQP